MSGMLESIRVFMRVVESGSFAEAARLLRLSSAVVSYRIGCLEEHLGCRLITRTTRRMSMTEVGLIFYEKCIEVVEALEDAEASISDRGGNPRGALKLTAPLTLGRQVIAPIVGAYRMRHPETELRLRLSDHLLDLVREAVDIALRMARLEDSTFTQHKIAEVKRVICAAPSYLEAKGAPQTPGDLLQHNCLLLRFPGSQQFRWNLRDGEKRLTIPVSGPYDADDGGVLTDWALNGHGLVLKPLFEVAPYIACGQLAPVLENYPPTPIKLAVLYPSRKMLPLRVRNLIDDIHTAVRQHLTLKLAQVGEKL